MGNKKVRFLSEIYARCPEVLEPKEFEEASPEQRKDEAGSSKANMLFGADLRKLEGKRSSCSNVNKNSNPCNVSNASRHVAVAGERAPRESSDKNIKEDLAHQCLLNEADQSLGSMSYASSHSDSVSSALKCLQDTTKCAPPSVLKNYSNKSKCSKEHDESLKQAGNSKGDAAEKNLGINELVAKIKSIKHLQRSVTEVLVQQQSSAPESVKIFGISSFGPKKPEAVFDKSGNRAQNGFCEKLKRANEDCKVANPAKKHKKEEVSKGVIISEPGTDGKSCSESLYVGLVMREKEEYETGSLPMDTQSTPDFEIVQFNGTKSSKDFETWNLLAKKSDKGKTVETHSSDKGKTVDTHSSDKGKMVETHSSTDLTKTRNPQKCLCGPSKEVVLPQLLPTHNCLDATHWFLSQPLPLFFWQGWFEVRRGGLFYLYDGIQAHLTAHTSLNTVRAVTKLLQVFELVELPRSTVWPTSCLEIHPLANNIAFYFFAKDLQRDKSFSTLADHMAYNDVCLKGKINGVELIIYSSNLFPEGFKRKNGMLFMCGILGAPNSGYDANILSIDVLGSLNRHDPKILSRDVLGARNRGYDANILSRETPAVTRQFLPPRADQDEETVDQNWTGQNRGNLERGLDDRPPTIDFSLGLGRAPGEGNSNLLPFLPLPDVDTTLSLSIGSPSVPGYE